MILLDTHVLIWLAQDHQRIAPAAESAIKQSRREDRGLAISAITLLEIARLASYGRISLVPDAATFLSDVETRFVVVPINTNIALQAFQLPAGFPKDPVDRVIAATALIEDIPLVTADREIRKSHTVPTIW